MENEKLVSFDLYANFGFFRKPETNEGVNLSFNMMHKPALLGILGAIIGLDGYKEKGKEPEYLQKLKSLKLGIKPLDDENGNFQKIVIKYSNTVGYANKGTNYLTEEATLIKPGFRCYLLLDLSNEDHIKLGEYLKEGKAEYLPYFGKNEFYAWWKPDSYEECDFSKTDNINKKIRIDSLFLKTEKLNEDKDIEFDLFDEQEKTFMFFERLPSGFDEELMQYQLNKFAFTNLKLTPKSILSNLFYLKDTDKYVQLI